MNTALTRSSLEILATNDVCADGREKVSGRTKYTADIHLPNMLWAAYTKSPFAYARIVSIDTTAAKAVPGVKAVLTWKEIGRRRMGRQIFDWPVLCYDVVRFVGDRVAAIAAETRDAAEEAAALVDVVYEELKPILTEEDAVRGDAALLHPDFDSYYYLAYENKTKPVREHPNLQADTVIAKGDPDLDRIFASAHRVFEHVFHTPRQHCGYIEPHATLVWVDDDGTVHVQSPNKSPFALRRQLAHVTELPPEKIIIEPCAIGGDFGGKGLTIDEFPCYYLAKATGRPVRHVHLYSEELQRINVRHPATLRLKTAVDEHGRFIAHKAQMLYNGGAYGAAKVTPNLLQGVGFATIPYHIPNVRLELKNAYTNTVPSGHMRSPADVQSFFGWEQHVDMIARAMGIDPLELRLLNVITEGQTAVTDETVPHPVGVEVLETLRRECNYDAPVPAGRGRGTSFVCRHTGQGEADIRLAFEADGSIKILTGLPDQGSGGHAVVQRVAAAVLSVAVERVSTRRGSTGEAPLDPGAGSSRVTHVQGTATRIAAEKLRAELEARSGLRLQDDRFVDDAGSEFTIEEVAPSVCDAGPIEVMGHYNGVFHSHEEPADYSFSAFCLEVAVDADTGTVKITDALLVTDAAQIINPIGHQGQIEGGFVYGIGGALMEEMPVDENGRLATPSLAEYKLPTAMDIPPFRTVIVKAAPGRGPFGAKMAGELSNSGVAPAIVNAIDNAVGVRVFEMPITAERVYEALCRRC